MRTYIGFFLEKFEFDKRDWGEVFDAYDALEDKPQLFKAFEDCLQTYKENMLCDFVALFERIDLLASESGLNPFTLRLVFLICLSKQLKAYYEKAGFPIEVWENSVIDIKYKAGECRALYKVTGIFASAPWHAALFGLKRFGFENLQFMLGTLKSNYEKNGIRLTPETSALWVHIPRTGERLEKSRVDLAYQKASAFFKKHFSFNSIIFVCKTWLFYSKTLEFLAPESNLAKFSADYDILFEEEYSDYSWRWRLFDTKEESLDKLPTDTSLRKKYVDWMRQNGKTGSAYGIYLYQI